jgi:hypothetical protein
MKTKWGAVFAVVLFVLTAAAPVSAGPPSGTGQPTEHVISSQYTYTDTSCGAPYDVVGRQSVSYWYYPGSDQPMKQSGTVEEIKTNPASGKWIEERYGGEAQWGIPLDWSPARQVQVIGRTLTENEILERFEMGEHWGAYAPDGRTLAFHAEGWSNLYVYNVETGETVWSLRPSPVGGGSFQRMPPDDVTYCDAMASWLT